jgi:hypothetical protein
MADTTATQWLLLPGPRHPAEVGSATASVPGEGGDIRGHGECSSEFRAFLLFFPQVS